MNPKRTSAVMRMRLFLLGSMGLHLMFVVMYSVGAYARRGEARRAEALARSEAYQAEVLQQHARARVERQARAGTQDKVAEGLRRDLEKLVARAAVEPDARVSWPDVTNAIAPELEHYAAALADPRRTEADLQRELATLQHAMVKHVRQRVGEARRHEVTERFTEQVREKVMPDVVAAYRASIERNVGRALQRESANLVREEHKLYQRVAGELRKQAGLAATESAQAQASLQQAAAIAAQGRVPQKELGGAQGALERVELRLQNAAKLAAPLGGDLAGMLDGVRGRELAAARQARDAAGAAGGAVTNAPAALDGAVAAAGALAEAAAEAREAVDTALGYDPALVARAGLRRALDGGGTNRLATAFRDAFETNALPAMTEQLMAALEKVGGMGPDGDDEQARRRGLAALLADAVGDGLDAAGSAVSLLQQSEGLEAPGPGGPSPGVGALREAAVAEAAMGLMQRHADGAMASQGGAEVGTRALAQALRAHTPEWATGSDGLDDALADAAASLEEGRSGFFEDGSDALSFRSQRQEAMDRAQYAQQASRSGYVFLQDAYEQLTAGMEERGREVQGAPAALSAPADTASAPAPATASAPRPGRLLVDGDAGGPPVQELSAHAPFEPSFKSICFARVAYRTQPIAVDGDLGEWEGVEGITLPVSWGGGAMADPSAPTSQTARVAWDHRGLYFAFHVVDPDRMIRQVPHVLFWDGDAVEIYLDGRNRKERHRTRAWGQQFWCWPFGQAGDANKTCGEAFWTPEDGWYWAPHGRDYLQQAASRTADGWTIEILVPRERLSDLPLEPGRIFGLNLSVCTGTQAFYYLSGSTAVHPSDHPDTWGDALLAGSDGSLSVRASADLPPGAFAIGEQIHVQVEDADMNLAPDAVDRLAVVADGASGDSETVVLEETGPDTGVFEGMLATDLMSGDPQPGVLSLYEGEALSLRYLDQARANAARNVDVRLSLHAAAGVTDG
ncbi:MAG: hypothetical protein K8T26_19330 [Lentisphaerae bacterium]|nr:hypothetical protein [Lentisphaerota bacterium]